MVAGIPRTNVSTNKDEWCTPIELYDKLNEEFRFDLDAACDNENCLCAYALTKEMDSLKHAWAEYTMDNGEPARSIFLNPPYGRGVIAEFVKKAFWESLSGATVVCLLPFSGASWFTDYCLHAAEIRILGRVKFIGFAADGSLIKNSPTFDSCVVVFKPGHHEVKLSKFRW